VHSKPPQNWQRYGLEFATTIAFLRYCDIFASCDQNASASFVKTSSDVINFLSEL